MGKSTFCNTVRHGNRTGLWKTTPISRRGPATFAPWIRISPAVGPISPATIMSNVLLPQPLGPNTLRNSPSPTSNDSWRIASRSPKVFLRAAMRTIAAPSSRVRPGARAGADEATADRIEWFSNPAVGSHNVGAKPRTPRLGDFCAELARRPSQPHHTIILITGTLRMTPLGRACKLLLWASHPRCARRPAPCRSAVLRCKLEFRHGSRVVRRARPALGLDRRRRSARSTAHARACSRCGCRRCEVMRGGATMKPSNFEFARATSLAEAATILRQAAGSARVVAGGQSLGPMLNLRLVQPSILVDITAIPELTHIDEDADGVIVGACVTTSDIEDGRVRVEELPILASVAGGVAYRAVRNRGTIGGSICHADPAGDWLPTLCALAAEC